MKKMIFFELVLIISSVLIFRSMWTLLDKIEVMKNEAVLVISLILGVVLTAVSLYYYNKGK